LQQQKLRIRALFIIIGIVAFLVSYWLGAYTKLDSTSALKLRQEFMQKIVKLNYLGIFTNNLTISLIMFIPGIGILFGLFSGYSTGLVFSAIIQTSHNQNQISTLLVLLTPFGIMEIFCYGLAISRSSLLLISLIKKHNILKQLKFILIEIAIVVGILFFAAVLEWYFINFYSGINTPALK
jgi:uncharacterized membrane protein SpoIIM required for sporulation